MPTAVHCDNQRVPALDDVGTRFLHCLALGSYSLLSGYNSLNNSIYMQPEMSLPMQLMKSSHLSLLAGLREI